MGTPGLSLSPYFFPPVSQPLKDKIKTFDSVMLLVLTTESLHRVTCAVEGGVGGTQRSILHGDGVSPSRVLTAPTPCFLPPPLPVVLSPHEHVPRSPGHVMLRQREIASSCAGDSMHQLKENCLWVWTCTQSRRTTKKEVISLPPWMGDTRCFSW